MNNLNISIRNLKAEDIPAAMDLVLAEGWNQTEKDWRLFLSHPENVCKCAEIDGQLVATTTSCNFFNEVAWISMVLVNKKFRGLGISKMLLKTVLKELENCKSIKLDATEAGRKVYQKFGFADEYRISRMVNNSFNHLIVSGAESPAKIMKKDVADIIEFDTSVFGAKRPHLIKSWIWDDPKQSWMLKCKGQINGFVLGREGNRFFQIGPLSVKKLQDAKTLTSQVLYNLKGKAVVVDVINDKTELIQWLTSTGFVKRREFTRMYYRDNSISGEKTNQFLIAGPEFG